MFRHDTQFMNDVHWNWKTLSHIKKFELVFGVEHEGLTVPEHNRIIFFPQNDGCGVTNVNLIEVDKLRETDIQTQSYQITVDGMYDSCYSDSLPNILSFLFNIKHD